MLDNQPPRTTGLLAAQNLNLSVDDNPMDPADTKGGKSHDRPGHPHYEWRNGFIDGRILLHTQNSRNLALGRGLVLLYQTAPIATREALITMGRKSGELVCLTVLAAMLEAEESRYDLDDPELVLAIYSAMKQRMSGKAAHCHIEQYRDLNQHVHAVAGALLVLFKRIDRATIQLDVQALDNLLTKITELAIETQKAIHGGSLLAKDAEIELPPER